MSETRLSTLDASFLEVESPSAHMHVGWAALSTRRRAGRRRASRSSASTSPAGSAGRRDTGRSSPRCRSGVNDPVWIDDERVRPRPPCPSQPDATDLGGLDRRGDVRRQLDRDRPAVGAVDRRPPRRRTDRRRRQGAPRMVDGLAAVELATLLLDPTPEPPPADPTAGCPAGAAEPARAAGRRASLDRAAGRARASRACRSTIARHPRRLIARGRRRRCRAPRALADSLRPADAGHAASTSRSRPRGTSAGRVARWPTCRRIKGRFGATVNDVVLAAAAGAMRSVHANGRGETPGAAEGDGAGERPRGATVRASSATRSRSCSSTCRATSPTRVRAPRRSCKEAIGASASAAASRRARTAR